LYSDKDGAVADQSRRSYPVQKKSVGHALLIADSKSITTDEAVSLLAVFIVELREKIAALEYQVVRLRLQLQDDRRSFRGTAELAPVRLCRCH
jgi:uncharacterized small protein (DUF1192 family)